MTESRDITALGPKADDADVAEHMRRRPERHSGQDDESIRRFAVESARLCADLHCTDVVVFDVRGLSDMCDYILVGSGTSDRQIKSVAGDLAEHGEEHGHERIGREQDGDAKWVVVDFVDVIVHLFEPVTRAHYDLEMLWGDAPQVAWRRETAPNSPAGEE